MFVVSCIGWFACVDCFKRTLQTIRHFDAVFPVPSNTVLFHASNWLPWLGASVYTVYVCVRACMRLYVEREEKKRLSVS